MDRAQQPPPARSTRATDHLANERTFLAWIRTSLAVIGVGFAVAKFGAWLQEMPGAPLPQGALRGARAAIFGILIVAVGALFALIAATRHRDVARQIEEGQVHPAHAHVTAVTVIIVALAVAVGILALR